MNDLKIRKEYEEYENDLKKIMNEIIERTETIEKQIKSMKRDLYTNDEDFDVFDIYLTLDIIKGASKNINKRAEKMSKLIEEAEELEKDEILERV